MKVLVACESSGTVRDEFLALGFDAYSVDLLPADSPSSRHIQGDAFEAIENLKPTLLIAHPPCTYLCVSGLHWNTRRPERKEKTEEALQFVQKLMQVDVPFIAIENPVGCISTRIRKPDCKIQPW